MFIIQLKFSKNKGSAGKYMDGHNAWLKKGFAEGIFLLAGSLKPDLGGGILAHNISMPELHKTLSEDPFVVHDVVAPDVVELSPVLAEHRLEFLLQ